MAWTDNLTGTQIKTIFNQFMDERSLVGYQPDNGKGYLLLSGKQAGKVNNITIEWNMKVLLGDSYQYRWLISEDARDLRLKGYELLSRTQKQKLARELLEGVTGGWVDTRQFKSIVDEGR